MNRISKWTAILAAVAFISVPVPAASAFQVLPPSVEDIFAETVYHFDDGTSLMSVDMPEGEYTWSNRPTLEVINNTGSTLFCTYWYGPEPVMRPAYDVVLYGKASDAAEHENQMLKVVNESGRVGEASRMYETHYSSGSTYRIPLEIFDQSEEPLAVISKCYSSPLDPNRSFNYIVVDQNGTEIPELIPDAAAIRAEVDKPSHAQSSLSSFGSS